MKQNTWKLLSAELQKNYSQPQSKTNRIMNILAIWSAASVVTISVLGVYPHRTWGTLLFFLLAFLFFLPAFIIFAIMTWIGIQRLTSPYTQRYGTWMLFRRTEGSLWPARLILLAITILSLAFCIVLIWGYFQLPL